MWALIIFGAFLYWLYRWSTSTFNVFAERGIPHEKPIPLIGNAKQFLNKKSSLHRIIIQRYRETKQHKIYGSYNFRSPFFIVNDPKIVKQMAIKDFEIFANHQRAFETTDPILGALLPVLRDQRWKDMRNTITPCFTSAKMRAMFALMIDCFHESMQFLDHKLDGQQSGDIDLSDFFAKLSNDLIATTSFGINVNSFADSENAFYTIGQTFTKTRGKQAIKFFIQSLAPKLFKLLGLKVIDAEKVDYFAQIVIAAIAYRKKHNIVRPDMIQLLIEAQAESGGKWSQEDIIAQCFIFFFASFENNAKLLSTACYELAMNPEIQNRLYDEINDVRSETTNLDYDIVQNLEYMDMVVAETQRKWSLVSMLDRECGADYTVKDEDGNKVCDLKKGDRIWLQTIGFHWDEEYFKNPEIFDPERFSKESKVSIDPFTYMPFGVGPRSCIGNRYALMQAKAMLFYLLSEYKLEPCAKTPKDLMSEIRGFQLDLEDGYWLKFVKRQKTDQK